MCRVLGPGVVEAGEWWGKLCSFCNLVSGKLLAFFGGNYILIAAFHLLP